MTPEERFERIERDLGAIYQSQSRNQDLLSDLMRSVAGFVDSTNARTTHLEEERTSSNQRMTRIEGDLDGAVRSLVSVHETLDQFIRSIDHAIRSGEERARRIEESLEAFIRSITARPGNGKATG